ncbi:MAG: DUF2207 domain-containing protein [Lactobacillus sp.]
MHKKLTLLAALLLSCIGFLARPKPVQAASFDITRYQVNIKVHPDGSATLQQAIRYQFDGSAHGVYYNQALRGNGTQTLSQPQVQIKQNGQIHNVVANNSKANNSYQLDRTQERVRFTVYHRTSGGPLTVIYRYRLSQIVKNYADTAEINWKVIGSRWDVPLNQVKIQLQLPQEQVPSLRAWAHSSEHQLHVSRKQGLVTLTSRENTENQPIELHLIFDPKLTPQNHYRSSAKRRSAIIRQEARLAQAAAEAARRRERGRIIGLGVSLVLAGIFSLMALLVYGRTPANRHFPVARSEAPHVFDIPTYSAPLAQLLYFDRNQLDNRAFSAHLLELAAQKRIAIIETNPGKHPDYRIELLDQSLLTDSEEPLMACLLQLKPNHQISFRQLRHLNSVDQGKVASANEAWHKRQREQLQALNYRTKHQPRRQILVWLSLAIVCFLIAVILMHQPGRWLWLLAFVIASGFLTYLAFKKFSPYTVHGVNLLNQVRGFRRMLHDMGRFNLREVQERILWEDIMPYAVSFNLAPKVTKVLKTNFSDAELNDLYPSYAFLLIHSTNQAAFFSLASSSFTAATGSNSSGGSFSGGGSGGFGGGSGGGAF